MEEQAELFLICFAWLLRPLQNLYVAMDMHQCWVEMTLDSGG